MQSSGRIRVYAPECVAHAAIGIGDGAASSIGGINGDSVTTTAITAGEDADTVNIDVADLSGFADGQVIIVSYGTDREEEVTIAGHGTTAIDSGGGTGEIVCAAHIFANDHPKGSRVVVKRGYSIRPGSVKVLDGATQEGIDDGKGNIIGRAANGTAVAGVSGWVDYSTGSIQANVAASGGAVTVTFDTLTDSPEQNSADGSGYFVNHQGGLDTRKYIPDSADVTNLGDTEVGVFVEVSKNGGKSWTTRGTSTGVLGLVANAGALSASPGAVLRSLGRSSIRSPGGRVDMLRVRAGVKSGDVSDVPEVQPGQVEFDFHIDTSIGAMGA